MLNRSAAQSCSVVCSQLELYKRLTSSNPRPSNMFDPSMPKPKLASIPAFCTPLAIGPDPVSCGTGCCNSPALPSCTAGDSAGVADVPKMFKKSSIVCILEPG